ncbi:KTSC domain-containing protein [Leeuwenhoekiella nanhaiensis]|uniref:Molecular chaperone DnaJ n=1 Tax=Leeuwenhoekiella nanhaiensis TaxID=1655491 RepID=A0A2G1VTT5_9FLAO|nr:KTSC domain-containing protein [Leeuwenhoekiella nanhaiensis]PHQ30151.1 molecular chaperone DnaJ [Leeuwenhoekiella nanhaiensis]
MKRITAYRKLFNTDKDADLKQLKSAYRNLVKEWHPDKFQEGDARKEEAELKSREIIDAYHFLVSIAPETHEANKEVYTETITQSGIADYQHKGLVLEITFTDGSTYEYFGITKQMFLKFHNAGNPVRFAKRNIYNSFLYRKSKRYLQEA